MIRVEISPVAIAQAQADAAALGHLRNSITKGDGNVAGFLGEILVADFTGAVIDRTYDYDLVLGKSRIDVKTKRTTVPPRETYECSIADYNTTQGCDLYAFVRILNDLTVGWLLGCIPKDLFYKNARFLKKGQIDGSNKFIVKADCYNIAVADLLELPHREERWL